MNIIVLGPCHKTNLPLCGLSNLEFYQTPLGILR